MSKSSIGVLVMSYGTPRTPEGILPYYTHIRRGRPPEPQQLADLAARYEAIGGLSPLNEISLRQEAGIREALHKLDPDGSYRLYSGMKHVSPFLEEVTEQMYKDGVEQAVGVVLAPHYSVMSVGGYIHHVEEKAAQLGGPRFAFVKSWHLEPEYLDSTAGRIRQALERFSASERQDVKLIFTAHSLPKRIVEMGDPYPQQLEETARAVAERLGHSNWMCGWQSAGRTPEPWLGPDILEILRQLSQEGVGSVLICPVGFVSDHLEILYDVDIEAKALARELGMRLERPDSPNDEPLFLEAIARAVLRHVHA